MFNSLGPGQAPAAPQCPSQDVNREEPHHEQKVLANTNRIHFSPLATRAHSQFPTCTSPPTSSKRNDLTSLCLPVFYYDWTAKENAVTQLLQMKCSQVQKRGRSSNVCAAAYLRRTARAGVNAWHECTPFPRLLPD
jgi:hypothetical protein